MPRRPEPLSPTRWSPRTILAIALGLGLLAGSGEVLVHYGRRVLFTVMLPFGRDAIWQLPLADAALFVFLALPVAAAAVWWKFLRTPGLVAGLLGALAVFVVLLLFERVHWGARAFLSLAVGVGLARVVAPRAAGFGRVGARLALGALAGILLLGAALPLQARWRSSRATARLPAPRAGATHPNVLLILLDTVRAWNLGVYGYARPTTPRLNQLAAQGAVFDRVLSNAPWTTPAHASLFTGFNPNELSVSWTAPLDRARQTVAEALSAAGYETVAFVANYRYAGSSTGLARGFVRYEDYPLSVLHAIRSTALGGRLLARNWVAERVGRRRLVGGTVGTEVTGQFLDWLARGRRADRPFFAFLNYFDAHAPYLPPAPYDSMYFRAAGLDGSGQRRAQYWERLQQAFGPAPVPVNELEESLDAYDGAITFLDAQIDSLVRALGSRRLLDNTLVIVTSDHGELFGEHGIIQHGNSLYLPALYIPLYMRWPARVPPGLRVQSPVSLRNLARTIVDLAGADAPAIPGVSLERTWAPGPFGLPEDTLFASLDYNSRLPRFPPSPVLRGAMASVVLDSLQYILNGDGLEELYHLGMDSWQLRNLAAEAGYGGRLGDYRQALTALLNRSRSTGVQAGGR